MPSKKKQESKKNKIITILVIIFIFVITIVFMLIFLGKNENDFNEGHDDVYTIYYFGSSGCYPCRQLEPIIEEISEKYDENVKIIFYESWYSTSGANKASLFNVTNIPTLVFLNKNKQEVYRLVGLQTFLSIDNKIKELGWD